MLAGALALFGAHAASAAEIKVLTAGVMREVVLAAMPEFEKATGHSVVVQNATAGRLRHRIEGGEPVDVAVITPVVIDALIAKGRIVPGSRLDLARVGVGVVVREGTPLPEIGTVEAFKRTLLAAKSVAYRDPASGGTSGIYVAKMLERLGIADAIKAKAVLVQSDYVAERVIKGEAEIGLHQISEILAVKDARLVGPLPAEIQNYTTYSAAIGAAASDPAAAKAFIALLAGPNVEAMLKARGLERVR
jgi:molybdate transport system substrate-binding protein